MKMTTKQSKKYKTLSMSFLLANRTMQKMMKIISTVDRKKVTMELLSRMEYGESRAFGYRQVSI